MKLKFTNNTGQDIKGVEGTVTFFDIFDDKIKALNISYDEGLIIDEEKIWEVSTDYNQFMDEDIELKSVDLENLKYEWKVKTIVFDDDTKESY